MNILLTGANGFVGKALTNGLAVKANHVFASTRNIPLLNHNTNKSISYISNYEISTKIKDCDVFIHLAGRAHVMHETNTNPYEAYIEVNVHQTVAIAKQAIEAGVKRFLFVSSIKVLGEFTNSRAYTEQDSCLPDDDYGKSKLEAENALKNIFKNTNTELVIIRPPLIYGAGVKANFKNLISLCHKPIPLPFGAIQNKRSFIYLENLVDFIEVCCNHPKAANQTFLASDDEDVSTSTLIKSIRKALNKPSLLMPVPQALLEKLFGYLGKDSLAIRLCGNFQVDITKAKTLLGWQPPYTFEQGIQKTVEAYLRNEKKNI